MADKPMRTVAGAAQDAFVEKKSRFIGQISPAETEADAIAFLEQVRGAQKGATHNCYAWVVGENDEYQRSADAGEPAGTAGRPILEAIKRADLHNTVIVVTRYFGGIKLGASGLIRAYSHAAALALEAADIAVYTPFTILTATVAYPLVSTMERFVPDHGGTITGRDFAADVTFTMEVPQSGSDAFAASLTDTTSGRVTCRKTGTIVKPVVSG